MFGNNFYICRSYRGKTSRGAFLVTPKQPWIGLKIFIVISGLIIELAYLGSWSIKYFARLVQIHIQMDYLTVCKKWFIFLLDRVMKNLDQQDDFPALTLFYVASVSRYLNWNFDGIVMAYSTLLEKVMIWRT